MKDDDKSTRKALKNILHPYLAGFSPEMVEQLRELHRLAVPQLEPDEEELALRALAKELVALKQAN